MDGLPALDLWDVAIEVFVSFDKQHQNTNSSGIWKQMETGNCSLVFTRAARRKGGVAVHPPGVLLGHHVRWDAGPKPNQLPEDHRLFLQKAEEELTIRPIPPWDISLRGSCAQPHAVPSIQKRPQDLFPQRLHQI